MPKVFKFGGASVKNAAAVRNVASILRTFPGEQLVVVVSAMGKTTNALETLLESWMNKTGETSHLLSRLKAFHSEITEDLFPDISHPVFHEISVVFSQLETYFAAEPAGNSHFHYDQVVSKGEMLSSLIVSHFLEEQHFKCRLFDARSIIRTNNNWREGKIDWETTEHLVLETIGKALRETNAKGYIAVTQGFIGGTENGYTTTLGREGSDYTAAVVSFVLDVESMTVWKDVPGVLNADPKYFSDTQLLKHISYREAIELTYYGASVIHPKTIKPLQNKGIPLFVKSFLEPDAEGTVIGVSGKEELEIPSVILKFNQVLISISPKDFSFIAEQNLSDIFAAFAGAGIRIHMMQNSAISFSACITHNETKLSKLFGLLGNKFMVKYNKGLQLITIRHYNNDTTESLLGDKKILVEQRSRSTAQFVVKEK